ncbi:hypothetical protein V2S84_24910 [Azotobacter chroococcum]|nr:hypothetical protein [Azotobacter chroococcum]
MVQILVAATLMMRLPSCFHAGNQCNQAVGQNERGEDHLKGQTNRNTSCERRAKQGGVDLGAEVGA